MPDRTVIKMVIPGKLDDQQIAVLRFFLRIESLEVEQEPVVEQMPGEHYPGENRPTKRVMPLVIRAGKR